MKKNTGQALLELSIFGALFLVFLGALISYGLKFNYQQHVMQRTFRKALYYSNLKQRGDKGNINYLSIEDRHVPDPLDTFGVGVVSTYQSYVSLMRDYEMYKSADDETSLPSIAIDFKGLSSCPGSRLSPIGSKPPCFYLTAGFAIDRADGDTYLFLGDSNTCPNDRGTKFKKYAFIFGESNVIKYEHMNDPWKPGKDEDEDWHGLIRVIDSCEGEILSYSSCAQQCKLITDPEYCKRICEKEIFDSRWKFFAFNPSGSAFFYDLKTKSMSGDSRYVIKDRIDNEAKSISDRVTIVRIGIVKVWTKIIFSEKHKQFYIKFNNLDAKKYEKLDYNLTLYKIDCPAREFKLLETINYASDGSVLGKQEFPESFIEWKAIEPNSVIKILFDQVCKIEK